MFLSQIMESKNVTATLQYIKLTPNALPPTRGSSMTAGIDLKSAYDITIPAFGKGLVETDLAILVPTGCYGRIAPRSGLAIHHHISVGGGVIDSDYRGNVCHPFQSFCHTISNTPGGQGSTTNLRKDSVS